MKEDSIIIVTLIGAVLLAVAPWVAVAWVLSRTVQ